MHFPQTHLHFDWLAAAFDKIFEAVEIWKVHS